MLTIGNLSNCSSFDDLNQNENEILKQQGYATINLPQTQTENLFQKIDELIRLNLKFIANYEQITSYFEQSDFDKIITSFEESKANQLKIQYSDNEKEIFQIMANFFNLELEIYILNSSSVLEKFVTITSQRTKLKKPLKPLIFFKNIFGDYLPLIKLEKYEGITISKKIISDCVDWIFYPKPTKFVEKQQTLSSQQLLFISQALDKQQKNKKAKIFENYLYYDQLQPQEIENKGILESQQTMNYEKFSLQPATRANSTNIGANKQRKLHAQNSIELIRKEILSYEQNQLEDIVNEEEEEDDENNSNNYSTEDSRRFISN